MSTTFISGSNGMSCLHRNRAVSRAIRATPGRGQDVQPALQVEVGRVINNNTLFTVAKEILYILIVPKVIFCLLLEFLLLTRTR